MIVTGLDHCTIRADADTIEACVAFYTSMLNLRIGFKPPYAIPGFWLYAGDQPLIHLRKDHLTSVIELLCKPLKSSTGHNRVLLTAHNQTPSLPHQVADILRSFCSNCLRFINAKSVRYSAAFAWGE